MNERAGGEPTCRGTLSQRSWHQRARVARIFTDALETQLARGDRCPHPPSYPLKKWITTSYVFLCRRTRFSLLDSLAGGLVRKGQTLRVINATRGLRRMLPRYECRGQFEEPFARGQVIRHQLAGVLRQLSGAGVGANDRCFILLQVQPMEAKGEFASFDRLSEPASIEIEGGNWRAPRSCELWLSCADPIFCC